VWRYVEVTYGILRCEVCGSIEIEMARLGWYDVVFFVAWCQCMTCGVVWCGVVWCGVVVWSGVVWCGVVQMAQYVVWRVRYGVVFKVQLRCSIAQGSEMRDGVARRSVS
jgi:hypothetical protein